jgi:CheY-like chemotaxis protein
MIVVLTTSMNPEDRKKAAQITGIAAYEIKPLTQHLLQKMLLKYLPGTGSEQ